MNRRTQRIGNLIRNTLAELMFKKLADPRIDPGKTSITRVEVPEDLLTAKVFISVMGSEADGRRTVRGLQDAAGHLQDMLASQIRLRNTPRLVFEYDVRFKRTLETLETIERAMEEIRERDLAREADAESALEVDEDDLTDGLEEE